MKRVAFTLIGGVVLAVLGAWLVPAASAQEHGQIGFYADYFRLAETKTNFGGAGARFGVNARRWLQFEGEMNYDFNQIFPEVFTDPVTGTPFQQRSNIRVLHGLFGLKLQRGRGFFRPFLTVKGGFINLRLDPRPATFATFTSSIESLRSQDMTGVTYLGAGLERDIGPFGLRMDIGDEIYFNNGAQHNFRIAFGPILRF